MILTVAKPLKSELIGERLMIIGCMIDVEMEIIYVGNLFKKLG